ncbi:phenol hydroxylase subunit [Halomonas organivorans]|uniref:Phenol hydroxylase P0 protein n=1 Tax=Halomonas organivorans TaxID=257772 RepID=A0A7W5G452_9GAMM|nr:phenol hydroxylase subunit [Halomonas organivorans]MBB3139774.1 phenol hydroxylase P0 protein [Halomonas organivorans]
MSQSAISRSLKRYVRVRERSEKFVEFDFAIENPELFVELILPPQAFESFCARNEVTLMTEEQARQVDIQMEKWRYSVGQ